MNLEKISALIGDQRLKKERGYRDEEENAKMKERISKSYKCHQQVVSINGSGLRTRHARRVNSARKEKEMARGGGGKMKEKQPTNRCRQGPRGSEIREIHSIIRKRKKYGKTARERAGSDMGGEKGESAGGKEPTPRPILNTPRREKKEGKGEGKEKSERKVDMAAALQIYSTCLKVDQTKLHKLKKR